jgi:UDPglucose 6-dehydrogenase
MKIGFLGLGKLGLPVALAVESKGHQVYGYDVSKKVASYIEKKKIPYKEIWAQKHLNKSNIQLKSIKDLVVISDIIFVAIQTPHDAKYEGISRILKKKLDFDYSYLINGIRSLSLEIEKLKKKTTVVIISTVLPGTIRREILPKLSKYVDICYNPFFIAMGTTMKDFLFPEFILIGSYSKIASNKVKNFYRSIHRAKNVKIFDTTIENAELIKVCYNTYISTKISFINTIMEVCHKIPGTDIDQVSEALFLANKRIISNAYLRGGMGDGGGCHPRDNIALSWLAKKLDLSYDWFENIMLQREKNTEWLVDIILSKLKKNYKDLFILGKTFKPETNICTGSPSILLYNILKEKIQKKYSLTFYDPYVDQLIPLFKKGVYFIGTKHEVFKKFKFPKGSIVIDPFRYLHPRKSFTLIKIGKTN